MDFLVWRQRIKCVLLHANATEFFRAHNTQLNFSSPFALSKSIHVYIQCLVCVFSLRIVRISLFLTLFLWTDLCATALVVVVIYRYARIQSSTKFLSSSVSSLHLLHYDCSLGSSVYSVVLRILCAKSQKTRTLHISPRAIHLFYIVHTDACHYDLNRLPVIASMYFRCVCCEHGTRAHWYAYERQNFRARSTHTHTNVTITISYSVAYR